MRDGPKHEIQHGMLDVVLAGQAPFCGQVLIKGIYRTTVLVGNQEYKFVGVMVCRFIAPAQEPIFPWNHWNELLGIDAWEYRQFALVEGVPLSAFTGVLTLSDIHMSYGHYTLMFAMIKMQPEDLVEGYVNHNIHGNNNDDEDKDDNGRVDIMDKD
ncbi:hypothetical protein FRC11_008102 [Ceratobasidium sp. 423]|nr:hypothetical protein FRC11_008102 [Ceratobasidium sp. 423]